MSRGFKIVLLIVLCLFLALLVPATEMIVIPALVVFGFVPFLRDAVHRVSIDWTAITTGIACGIVFAVGTHLLAARLWRSSDRGPWPKRWTAISVVGLFTVFAAGIAMIGVAHQVSWLRRGPIVHRSRPHAVAMVVNRLFRLAEEEHLDAAALRRHAHLLAQEDEFRIAVVADPGDAVRAVVGMPRDPGAGFRQVAWISKRGAPELPNDHGMLPAELYADVIAALERGDDPEAVVEGDRAHR